MNAIVNGPKSVGVCFEPNFIGANDHGKNALKKYDSQVLNGLDLSEKKYESNQKSSPQPRPNNTSKNKEDFDESYPEFFSYTFCSDRYNDPKSDRSKSLDENLERFKENHGSNPGKTFRVEEENGARSVARKLLSAYKEKKYWSWERQTSTSETKDIANVLNNTGCCGKFHVSGFRSTKSVIFGENGVKLPVSSNESEKEVLFKSKTKFVPLVVAKDKKFSTCAALEEEGISPNRGSKGYFLSLTDPNHK